jgi:hypothetical protein
MPREKRRAVSKARLLAEKLAEIPAFLTPEAQDKRRHERNLEASRTWRKRKKAAATPGA